MNLKKKLAWVEFVVYNKKETKLKKFIAMIVAAIAASFIVVSVASAATYPQYWNFEGSNGIVPTGLSGWNSSLATFYNPYDAHVDGAWVLSATQNVAGQTSYTAQTNAGFFNRFPVGSPVETIQSCVYVGPNNAGTSGKPISLKIRERSGNPNNGPVVKETSSVVKNLPTYDPTGFNPGVWLDVTHVMQDSVNDYIDVRISQSNSVNGNSFQADAWRVQSYDGGVAPSPCH